MSPLVGGGLQVWPLLAIWALGCGFRLRHRDPQIVIDCFMFGFISLWLAREELLRLVLKALNSVRGESIGIDSSLKGYLAASFTVAVAVIGLWRTPGKDDVLAEPLPQNASKWSLMHPGLWVFPCRTTHARVFPKRHAFGYSYLQCGYPIVPVATTATGLDISDGKDRKLGSWWLSVKVDDYLERGSGRIGFYDKLREYLRKLHVKDQDWSYAYLVTAPRFFGYAFNPVSFWYIYDHEHDLKMMILEVNNTFGERRMYLLDGSTPPSPPGTPGSRRSSVSDESRPGFSGVAMPKFTDVWTKDFHVSPFNSRKGSYGLKALNPFPCVHDKSPKIDNTITLKSSKDHIKLVARLYSAENAFNPQKLGPFGTLKFVLSWWWVGFMTSPRILREAFKLFFKRSLHVWYRPEVLNGSVGRLPTSAESALAIAFKDYLHQLVHEKEGSFCVTLKTAIPGAPIEVLTTANQHDRATRNLEIRVLTPAFYSRLVHYTRFSEAIDRECIFTDERNRTLWMCRPQLLPLLLSKQSTVQAKGKNSSATERGYVEELRWKTMKWLKCPPACPAYTMAPTNSSHSVDDIRPRPYSELDNFVRMQQDRQYAGRYRRITTQLFLAQRFCFGFPEVLDLVDLLLRAFFCYLGAVQLKSCSETSWTLRTFGFWGYAISRLDWTIFVGHLRDVRLDWWSLSRSVVPMFACHAYGMLKGYR